jgi:hypothetical protein
VRCATVHTRLPAVVLAGAALFAAGAAWAAVRVVEDEVVFSLQAPGASEVYLVGDFNNWNPTVEKMRRMDSLFEISLFMVEGSYRYKFVVDGQWIVDPDNPGDPTKGSPLVLVERPAGLMLSTSVPEEEAVAPSLLPWFRYIGQYRWNSPEEKEFEDNHLANLGLKLQRERLRGRAMLQWSDGWWTRYDEDEHVILDRGFIGTDAGGLGLDAFTDDGVVWTSLDPVALVGNVGVFDYNAGYGRNGISADLRLADAIHIRGLYADHTGALSAGPPVIPDSALSAAPSGADTTAYAIEPNPADSDVLGVELSIQASGYQGGIVTRRNRGLYPGVMAEVSPAESTAVVYDTRQDTDATFYWLGLPRWFRVGLTVGYGRGHAEIHQLTREKQRLEPPRDLAVTERSSEANAKLRFEKSDRFYAGLAHSGGRATARAGWDRVTFDFNGVVFEESKATVDRATFDFDWNETAWKAGLRLRYTHADYGETPGRLLVDSPVLNMWLDWRDKFAVPDIVGIGEDAYTDLSAAATWFPGRSSAPSDSAAYAPRTWPEAGFGPPPFVRLEVGTTTHRFFEALRYSRARLTAAYLFDERIYAMADGRVAGYSAGAWGASETYASGYIEAGYLYRWFNVNLGWGFDPVVFDPVVSDYRDIGREEVLRASLEDGVKRDEAAAVGRKLLSLERVLQYAQTIKLEVVVYF